MLSLSNAFDKNDMSDFLKKIKNFFIYTFQDLLIYLRIVIDISNEKKPIIGLPFLSSNLG